MWCQGRKAHVGKRNRVNKESQAVEDVNVGFNLRVRGLKIKSKIIHPKFKGSHNLEMSHHLFCSIFLSRSMDIYRI